MTEWTVVAGVDSSATASEIDTVANNIANVNIVGGISSDVTTVAGIASDVTSVSSISGNVTTVAGIDSNVTTVAGISGEITTVANDGTDIGVVAANTSNINTVAGINSDVTTVAGISSDVTTVAADGTDIGTVATDIANINTTAGSISNVNTVATNIANVNTVAADGTDIGVVAGISSDVTTVSGINANVTTVAGISADVTSVAGDAADIGTVATNIANVNTTAGSIANVNTVATDISNVNSVASNSTNINAVAANETNINAVNSNSTNINTVASNDTNITTVATDIANVNTTASNITDVNTFAERYRIDSSDPTTSLDAGDLVFNTTDSALKYYNGTSWTSITAGLTDIVGDVTPQLGGNLDLNSNDITGTGNINTTGNLTISGDLTVNGTTTTINSTTISVDDKNIELGATASPTDLTADGGGITLKGSTDHTLNWVNSTDAWTSSEHLNLATGKEYKINNTSLKDVSETLTNKTINSASNTITITESNISDLGSYITASSTDTLTNKSGNISQWTNDSGYLTSFTETNDLSSAVTWANVPDANITQSSVTQHQAALSITESQISDLGSYITASSTDTLTNKSGSNSQWTNDAGYITASSTDTLTNKSGNISQWTNDSAYLTGNQTITLSGDASGSGTTAITVTVADDSHNHIISNVDGLQTALDAKAPLSNPTFTGNLTVSGAGTLQDVTGTYGSIEVDGAATGGYEGYSIGGRAVFMHNNSTTTGIYNDVNNHWIMRGVHGGLTSLYYNGAEKLQTSNTGVSVTGTCTATAFSGDGSALTGVGSSSYLTHSITTTTTNRALTSSFVTHLSRTFTVPAGKNATVIATVGAYGMQEVSAGQVAARITVSGASSQTGTTIIGHRGAFANYAGEMNITQAFRLTNSGSHTVNFQVKEQNGGVTMNYFPSTTDYLHIVVFQD